VVDLELNQLIVSYDPGKLTAEQIRQTVEKQEFQAKIVAKPR
jgi:hypothetical protein